MRNVSGNLLHETRSGFACACRGRLVPQPSPPAPQTEEIVAFGRTFTGGGLIAMLNGDGKDCDDHKQPEWLATINAAPAKNGSRARPRLLPADRRSKEQQNEAKRRDCIYWYGHSIEAP